MGLLDYYRKFDDIPQEEINRGLRKRHAEAKARALAEVPIVDLSSTEWPDFPNAEVMNAAIFAARGNVNGYPDPRASEVRKMLSDRHAVPVEQIVVGNGSTELMQSAIDRLLAGGGELLIPWPSYPPYPVMARRAGGRPIPIPLAAGRADVATLPDEVNEQTRALVLCNPNDPTGAYLEADAIGDLIGRIPDRVHVLIDEAYIEFQDVEQRDSVLRLVDAFANLTVFRTFSKIYGLSGMRAGYAISSAHNVSLLEAIGPLMGVNALTQAGVLHALKIGDPEIERRRALVAGQRSRLLAALNDLPVDAPDTQANFAWLQAAGLTGPELTARLERGGVIVAPGGPLGDDDHVRVSIRGAAATERLLGALESCFA
ncbi:MAG: histidinol-phosphate aminotransferase [Thermoleophilaceae bacterium]|nr:histidinol-phosphate aminotransferase [Thermoleophilaceae bacterium]